MLPASTDLFVIGGGPAGLATAIAARRRGLDVVLAEAAVPPIDKACGEGIMPDGLAAARSLGIDLNVPGAQPFAGIRFRDGESSVEARFPHSHGLGLPRTTLHRILTEHAAAAGVRLAWGARVGGISNGNVVVNDRLVRTRWIAGADGGRSIVRKWMDLECSGRESRRFAFRRHYSVAPWSEFMEIHWGDIGQLYITPVGTRELCVVLISHDAHLRLDEALPHFPAVAHRLRDATCAGRERGGISWSRRLKAVWRDNVAMVGDASGSVDAITGEGLCLAFQQAVALAAALEKGDLAEYERQHRCIRRRPELMGDLMLLLEHRRLRTRTLRAMAEHPSVFARMLAMHVGDVRPLSFVTNGLACGWRILTT